MEPADLDDQTAELLVRAGRYEDALAVCAPKDLPEVPVNLRGRAAWIEKERGNVAGAIARLHEVVAQYPDYYWGWSRLVEWHEQCNEMAESLAAAEQLVRLAPDNPVVFGNRGEARRRLGDLTGARADFARAWEMGPEYHFAGLSLFDQQLLAGDLDEAEETLEGLRRHADAGDVLFKEIQLAAKRRQRDVARRLFRQACLQLGGSRWHFDEALKALAEAGYEEEAEQTLSKALDDEKCNPLVGEVLVQRRSERGQWFDDQELTKLASAGATGRSALRAHAVALGKAKQQSRLLAFLRRHGPLFRPDTFDWGMIGHALSASDVKADALVVDWMNDWEQRPDAQPWMFVNLLLGLRGVGRVSEAIRVSEAALALEPDYTQGYHEVWLALEDALNQRGDRAEERLAGKPHGVDAYHQMIAELVEAVLRVDREPKNSSQAALQMSRDLLAKRAVNSEAILHDQALLRSYRRCVWHMAWQCKTLAALGWAAWRCWRPLLPKAKLD